MENDRVMVAARFVRLEGVESACLVLCPHERLPEELVVAFDKRDQAQHPEVPKRGPVVYRLVPSSSRDPEPVYREIFDE